MSFLNFARRAPLLLDQGIVRDTAGAVVARLEERLAPRRASLARTFGDDFCRRI